MGAICIILVLLCAFVPGEAITSASFFSTASIAVTYFTTVTIATNTPVITNLPSTADVSEDVTSSVLVYTVSTYDADGDDVTCSITSTSPSAAPFEMRFINDGTSLMNAVYVQSSPGLSYAAQSSYTLTITCDDGPNSAQNTLYVYVVENGMPIFLNLQNETSISSRLGVAGEVFTVLTQDDEGDILTYTLTCNTTSTCPFHIYSNGAILLSQSLASSTTVAYELDITATDGSSTTAAHRLTVFVDINSAPVLSNLPQTLQIAEDTASGTSLFLLSVDDANGDNCDVTVSFSPAIGASHFDFNQTSLILSLATGQALDYESVTQYTIDVTADDGITTSGVSVLTLDVHDVNESPILQKHVYQVQKTEGSAGQWFGGIPALKVTDPDSGDSLKYYMASDNSSNYCSYIQVSVGDGIFKYASDFDVDDSALSSLFTCYVKIEDTGGLSVTATVTVSIEDNNDNDPAFVSPSYFMTVSQSASVGTSLGVASATDADVSADNSQLSHSMSHTGMAYFDVSNSGLVTLKSSVSSLSLGTTLNATLYVQNPGSASKDMATLYVTVTDSSDDFWDSGANVAWVTLTIAGVVALTLAVAYCLYQRQPWKSSEIPRILKVKPLEEASPPLYHSPPNTGKPRCGVVTPASISIQSSEGRWKAWNTSHTS